MQKSTHHISLGYPLGGIIASAIKRLGYLFFYLQVNPYRYYVNHVNEISTSITANVFQRVAHNLFFYSMLHSVIVVPKYE